MTQAPSHFGRYAVLGLLGSGGFATVYRARDTVLQREVALKALRPDLADAEDRRRFLAEARALAALSHPNIVTVYDSGEAEGRPYFAMELVEGRTLAAVIAAGERVAPAEAVRILSDLAGALGCIHAAGLVHRDVKDSNVMLANSGRVVLMDFGIALLAAGPRLTEAGYGLGTAETAAPEQVRGAQVGPAADVYALGVLAYQLFSGRLPFRGDPAHVLYAHAHLPPPPLRELRPGLPERVYAAVDAALAKEPGLRPRPASAFARALQDGLAKSPPAIEVTPLDAAGRLAVQAYHLAGQGDYTSGPLELRAGFTTFACAAPGDSAGSLGVALLPPESPPAPLLDARRGYHGVRAQTLTVDGRYRIAVTTSGPWSIDVEQPDVAAIVGAVAAKGAGDGVAYVRLEAGVRRFIASHACWTADFFGVRLLDATGALVDRLVAATGPFSGAAERRIDASGTYVLVVDAGGAWSVVVE